MNCLNHLAALVAITEQHCFHSPPGPSKEDAHGKYLDTFPSVDILLIDIFRVQRVYAKYLTSLTFTRE